MTDDTAKQLDRLKDESDPVAQLAEKVRAALKRGPLTLAELSSKLDRGVNVIESAVEWLTANNYNVRIAGSAVEAPSDLPAGGEIRIDPKLYRGRKFKFGFITDNHMCSKYERLDVANALYDLYEEAEIPIVFNAGNILDGRCRFNQFDLIPGCESMEGQINYFTQHYPQRKNILTKFIAGDDHEGWWAQREGVDIGRLMESRAADAGREDLEYIGYLEADVLLKAPKGETWIRVMHPGGGSAYAISYAPQKIVESFQGGEKPNILLIGHYHKMDFCYPRNVFCISGGCTQDQTPFMRKKKLEAHVGGWLCEAELADDGHVSRLRAEFVPFYDKSFYHGKKEKFPRW